MAVQIANTPVSWGVHYPEDPRNEPWETVFDAIRAAGYRQTELGTLGYVPSDPGLLREELAARQLEPTAMYVFQPSHDDPVVQEEIEDRARRMSKLLAAVGGKFLVIIDERNEVRIPTAGRSDIARRLEPARFEKLAKDIAGVARAAREEGVTPVLHPHVAGYVEFEDEIEAMLAKLDPSEVGFCIDTGHCAYAGIDATALYRRFAERVQHLHFKDVDGKELERTLSEGIDFDTAMLNGVFCPIGAGVTDFGSFAAALKECGYAGSITIEQDHEPSDPDKMEKAGRGAVESREFVESLGLAEG